MPHWKMGRLEHAPTDFHPNWLKVALGDVTENRAEKQAGFGEAAGSGMWSCPPQPC